MLQKGLEYYEGAQPEIAVLLFLVFIIPCVLYSFFSHFKKSSVVKNNKEIRAAMQAAIEEARKYLPR